MVSDPCNILISAMMLFVRSYEYGTISEILRTSLTTDVLILVPCMTRIVILVRFFTTLKLSRLFNVHSLWLTYRVWFHVVYQIFIIFISDVSIIHFIHDTLCYFEIIKDSAFSRTYTKYMTLDYVHSFSIISINSFMRRSSHPSSSSHPNCCSYPFVNFITLGIFALSLIK
ncbi:hypothetical protein FDI40_gp534 [Agrobacterium phage Atu_ph07]|uniref:Uncharacterized protein n=1 Tax=Agrobacterium phage Atu_ph07 TaxID=2024264 RepID=A0A2L0V0I5_9CAUD|nr:hypothetical protein FDI40_gp534 [Agrobacterium phage Atu_ph07]AUZ95293.1 hypothetical protein [Agrobacterium phage Atu_ph07]